MAEEQQYETTTNGDQQYTEQTTYDNTFEQQPAQEGAGDATTADAGPGDRINASKNDDDERKIFVGGLSWETTVKDLKEYFAKFGDVADCTLKTDPYTHRSRGFGFVLFSEPESVDKVVAETAHVLHGKNIDPKRAKARGGREPIKKVFVGGLDPETPEPDIRTHFEKFGKIEEIDLPFDKMKNQRRAFCFITFESEAIVDAVVAQPKQTLGAKEVDVKKATPKNNEGGWGNQRGGYGGGQWGDNRGRGRGGGQRGRGRGSYDNSQGSWGNGSGYNGGGYYDYNQGYGGYGSGYDYNQGYGSGYGYDQSYYQGWGNQGYGSGYGGYGNTGYGGGYDYSGWGGYNQPQQGQAQAGYKPKAQTRGAQSGGYHPYSR